MPSPRFMSATRLGHQVPMVRVEQRQPLLRRPRVVSDDAGRH